MPESRQEGYFRYHEFNNFFVQTGKGAPVLFLHPLGGSSEFWKPVTTQLDDRFKTISIDFLGCGQSDKPDLSYTLDDFTRSIVAYLDREKLEMVDIVGNSLGGHVALLLAIDYPTRVRRLVVANPSGLSSYTNTFRYSGIVTVTRLLSHTPINPGKFAIQSILKSLHGVTDPTRSFLTDYFVNELKSQSAKQWKSAFTKTLQALVDRPLDHDLSKVDQSTLILWGTNDHLLGPKGGRTLSQKLPHSKLIEIPDVGHFPQLEAPNKVVEEIQKFLIL